MRVGKVVVKKVAGSENPADLMTKFLKRSEVVDRLWRMGIEWKDVRGQLYMCWADSQEQLTSTGGGGHVDDVNERRRTLT